jgi:hypothetical protein
MTRAGQSAEIDGAGPRAREFIVGGNCSTNHQPRHAVGGGAAA